MRIRDRNRIRDKMIVQLIHLGIEARFSVAYVYTLIEPYFEIGRSTFYGIYNLHKPGCGRCRNNVKTTTHLTKEEGIKRERLFKATIEEFIDKQS